MVTGAGINLSMRTSNEVVIKSSYFVNGITAVVIEIIIS